MDLPDLRAPDLARRCEPRLRTLALLRQMTEFFPNTRPPEPVPALLTEEDAVRFLRLDAEDRDMSSARRALRRLVERKLIRPCRVGKRSRFLRDELLRYLSWQTALQGEAPEG